MIFLNFKKISRVPYISRENNSGRITRNSRRYAARAGRCDRKVLMISIVQILEKVEKCAFFGKNRFSIGIVQGNRKKKKCLQGATCALYLGLFFDFCLIFREFLNFYLIFPEFCVFAGDCLSILLSCFWRGVHRATFAYPVSSAVSVLSIL